LLDGSIIFIGHKDFLLTATAMRIVLISTLASLSVLFAVNLILNYAAEDEDISTVLDFKWTPVDFEDGLLNAKDSGRTNSPLASTISQEVF